MEARLVQRFSKEKGRTKLSPRRPLIENQLAGLGYSDVVIADAIRFHNSLSGAVTRWEIIRRVGLFGAREERLSRAAAEHWWSSITRRAA